MASSPEDAPSPPDADDSSPPPPSPPSPPRESSPSPPQESSPPPPSPPTESSQPPPSPPTESSHPPPSPPSKSSPPPPSPPSNSSPPPQSPPSKSSPPPQSPPSKSSPPPPSPPPKSTPPPPVPASPPPSDSSPPPPQPASPPPPTPPAKSPPPDNSSDSPQASGPPPVYSPPASDGDGSPKASSPSPGIGPPPRPESGGSSSKRSPPSDDKELYVVLGIILGGVVVLALIFFILKRWRRKKQRHSLEHGFPPKGIDPYNQYKGPIYPLSLVGRGPSMTSSDFSSGQYMHGMMQSPTPNRMGGFGAKYEFSYEALAAATNGFSRDNLLGQGGFGFVHKGILPDGKVVAVKSLKSGSGQGEREFQAEVEIISRVHHRHLVSLVGYCIAGGQRMLVYEFVPNKTLEFHLHSKKEPVMDWAARRRIVVGSAKGLAYLHEDCQPRIIHRDIKAANILLDNNFEAMVADFGLAKLTSDNYTHVSTRVMGTFGYLAPEYAASGKLTEKSDVFSFGVMLLELISGRRPIDPANIMEDSLVDWARPLMSKGLETGDFGELVDPRLEGRYNPQEMSRMIACAAACIRHSARKRPRMSQVVRSLDGNSCIEDLNEGVKPGDSETYNPYDTRAYNADIMKFRKMVMSSDDSGTTSSSCDTQERRI